MPRILVCPRTRAPQLPLEGCRACGDFTFLEPFVWRERAEVENDETWLQPIPYVLLRNPAGEFWAYARTGGDVRLDGRRSCGVGGHVESLDVAPTATETLSNAARRELAEELGLAQTGLPPLAPQGLIYEGHSAIGRAHLGVLFAIDWRAPPPSPPAHEALAGLGFLPAVNIVSDPRFELWSRLAAHFLIPRSSS